MSDQLPETVESLLDDRYVLSERAGAKPDVDDPELHYGVYDRRLGRWAILPDATLCWGMTVDRAIDCLNELRGGLEAERGA